MSRISHFEAQPKTIHFWDYTILCRMNAEAAMVLQRLEYWDGTKDDGNYHAENINDSMEQAGQPGNQDTSHWIYKSADELHWELMGIVGEKKVPKVLDYLIKTLHYLGWRNNPYKGFDRRKQYEIQVRTIQNHLNYLKYIIDYFGLPFRRLRPVFYAIEQITMAGVTIEDLNVEQVIVKLDEFTEQADLPHFMKSEMAKFRESMDGQWPGYPPLRNFAEWMSQNCAMDVAKLPNASRRNADSIPQNCGSNNREYKQENTTREDNKEEGAYSEQDRKSPQSGADAPTHDDDSEIPYLPNYLVDQDKIHIASDQGQPASSEEKQDETDPASGDGYQKSDARASEQDNPPAETKKKRTRTPRPPKISPEEIDLYRRVFDDCRREALDDESECYPHTGASDKCIAELLEANLSKPKFVTPQKLHAVYVRLWNLPRDPRTGYCWREHMSIRAVCKNYEEHAMVLTAAAKAKQQQAAMTEDDLKRQVLARVQSGELLGGTYRYYQAPADQPVHYLRAEERAALFGGK